MGDDKGLRKVIWNVDHLIRWGSRFVGGWNADGLSSGIRESSTSIDRRIGLRLLLEKSEMDDKEIG